MVHVIMISVTAFFMIITFLSAHMTYLLINKRFSSIDTQRVIGSLVVMFVFVFIGSILFILIMPHISNFIGNIFNHNMSGWGGLTI